MLLSVEAQSEITNAIKTQIIIDRHGGGDKHNQPTL